jgi:hypothetical protein
MTTLDPRASQGTAVLAAAIAVVMSWQWGYQSAGRAFTRDHERVTTMTARLRDVESMVQTAGGQDAWRASQARRLALLKARLPQPSQLPALLNALVDGLKVGDVKLLNMEQGNMEAAHEGEQPLLFQGVPCFQLPVTITAEGRFSEVLALLERLTSDTFPSVLSLERVDLRMRDVTATTLGATLKVNLYVIGNPIASPANAS